MSINRSLRLFKESAKLALLRAPKWLVRPTVGMLWKLGLIQKHYYTFCKMDFPDAVLQGPFKGMRYLPSSAGSKILPKYLGTYEKELWPSIEEICIEPCDVLIDVGSAEGYYAVGLTLRLKPESTHCFDIEPHAHRLLRKIATLNHVDNRIHTHLGCSPEELQRILKQARSPVLIMDCEGAEAELLVPDAVPDFAKTRILVELHEAERPGITKRIQQQFTRTHKIESIDCIERTIGDLPRNVNLNEEDARFGMAEGRPDGMSWLMMRPVTETVRS